jgi:hypothetical protein
MDHVTIRDDGHWIWEGAVGSSGYGKIKSGGHRGQDLSVTHVVWEHHHGVPVPPGYDLDHLEMCLIILCVNPDHLEPVTKAENQRRRAERRETCGNGHLWIPENTGTSKNGSRFCKPCHADRERERRRRNRETRLAHPDAHCSRGHLRTPENTWMRDTGPTCRECMSESARHRGTAAA